MASKNRILIKLESTKGTGAYYTTSINPKNFESGSKLKSQKKYDWKIRQTVEFKQVKITKKGK